MIATATDDLPLAHVGSHCVHAVKRCATGLAQGGTFINVCHSAEKERWGNMKLNKKKKQRQQTKKENPNVQIEGILDQGAASYLKSKEAHITHTCIPLDHFVVCVCV